MSNDGRYNFSWDSYYTVSNNQKYDLINRIRKLEGTEDPEVIEKLREEWDKIQTEGEDPSLNEKFESEIAKYNERKERVTKSIDGKRALIEKVNAIKDSADFFNTAETLKEYQAQWRDLGYSGKKLNDSLWEEFSAANDYFFNRRSKFYEEQNQQREEAKSIKETLIKEAEEIKDSTDWYKVSRRQRELMDAWRDAGFASREVENELWDRFNAARQHFYKAQEAFFSEVREREDASRKIKETLIEETERLKDSIDFETVRARFDDMMETWKEAGHAGRKHEEALWAKFREGRDHFYARMSETNQSARESRKADIEGKVEELEHRIESIYEMNAVIEAKITQLEDRVDAQEELEETKTYLTNNLATLSELNETLTKLNRELERLS